MKLALSTGTLGSGPGRLREVVFGAEMTHADVCPIRLSDKYELMEGTVYLSGLHALVRLPMEQHRLDLRHGRTVSTMISGYEGSPLAGYDLELGRNQELLEKHNVIVRPAVNEELAANIVQGSQLASASKDRVGDGVVGIWYGKAPGLDRATDALRHANLGGAHGRGGALALVGDDSIAKSSTVPSSSEIAMAEIGMTVLSPSDPEDILFLGLHGVALSRFCGLWSGVKLATNVVDGAASTLVQRQLVTPVEPDRDIGGMAFRHQVSASFLQPELGRLERTAVGERVELARRYARVNELNRVDGDRCARVGVVAAGVTYRDLRHALRKLGFSDDLTGTGVRLLKLGMVHPLEPTIVDSFGDGLDEIVVIEEKRPFIELAIKDHFYGRPGAPAVSGRRAPDGSALLRSDADLPPELIAIALAERFAARGIRAKTEDRLGAEIDSPTPPSPKLLPLATRTPYFCSGCPHNRSTEVPQGSLVGAGIGCSALATFMDPARVGDIVGFSQMGSEGVPWIGMAPFVSTPHLIQNMGDGTYHHSGSLAIRASVAANSRITYKILYNSAVAMTGGQEAVGRLSVSALAHELLAEGVSSITITTEDPKRYRRVSLPRRVEVRHRDDLVEVQEQLAQVDGVTVIIHDQECATELRRKRKRGRAPEPEERVFINERVCEGCGDCGVKSNCLSVQPVQTEFGRKTQIHQASCNKDYSCLDGDCPSFLSVIPGRQKPNKTPDNLEDADLPGPEIHASLDDFAMRITGVGGTGIVTTAQVIATAATMAGLYVQSLDQMGMAQKGGAVVSDIRMSRRPLPGANKTGNQECDLYLACDLLVAADPANLEVTARQRTIAVTSLSQTPTGAMVTNTSEHFPDPQELTRRITQDTRTQYNITLDARAAALALFGDDQFANILMVGAAVQAGALPLDPVTVEEALTLNGARVDENVQAFRRGRQCVADPQAFAGVTSTPAPSVPTAQAASALAGLTGIPEGTPLRREVEHLAAELVAYQDRRYGERFARSVERVSAAAAVAGVSDQAIPSGFARSLYKLMAYKDEYEVARLSLDPEMRRRVEEQFGQGARIRYRLHPPALRALGLKRKLKLGRWFLPVFFILRAGRRLRGTPFDVFGIGHVRRTERALIEEFVAAVDEAMAALVPATADRVEAIVTLPDMVRGYEAVKMANVARFRSALASSLADLHRARQPQEVE